MKFQVTFDAAEPEKLGAFWALALDALPVKRALPAGVRIARAVGGQLCT